VYKPEEGSSHRDILKKNGIKSRNKTYNQQCFSNEEIYFPYLDSRKGKYDVKSNHHISHMSPGEYFNPSILMFL